MIYKDSPGDTHSFYQTVDTRPIALQTLTFTLECRPLINSQRIEGVIGKRWRALKNGNNLSNQFRKVERLPDDKKAWLKSTSMLSCSSIIFSNRLLYKVKSFKGIVLLNNPKVNKIRFNITSPV
jgi:hypothetical protein